MMRKNGNARSKLWDFVFVLILLILPRSGSCQSSNTVGGGNVDNPVDGLQLLTQIIFDRFTTISYTVGPMILERFSFCIKNVMADWSGAFGFESNLTFLSNCLQKTKGINNGHLQFLLSSAV
ncbi:hypothetical protein Ancab_012873 [Ancistrocladus abbreviatus]